MHQIMWYPKPQSQSLGDQQVSRSIAYDLENERDLKEERIEIWLEQIMP